MMSIKSVFNSVLSLFIVLIVFGSEAKAQFHTGAIAAATGGAGRAAVDPGEASYLNPAVLAHLRRYYGGANYDFGSHPEEGQFRQFGVLLADNSPGNLIAGSFSYQRRNTDFEVGGSVLQQALQASLGGFVYRHLALGVSAHRLYYQPDSGSEYIQDNGNVGLMFTPLDYLGLAFTAYNVLPASESVPVGVRLVPTFAIGSNIIIKDILHLRLDFVRPDKFNEGQRTNVMAGLESYFRDDFAFRLGGRWMETRDQMWVSTGIGFKGPKLSFDYTFEKDVRRADGSRHLFDLWLPF